MARPSKATVDYFPHTTHHGKTMYVLEDNFGNDGYAVWFKLLEQLGSTDGHILNLNVKSTVLHLTAYCRVKQELLYEICETLAELEAIDRDLWANKYIFCEQFVSGVKDAYKKRIGILPSKQRHIITLNLGNEFPAVETPENSDKPAENGERENDTESGDNETKKRENSEDSPAYQLLNLWDEVFEGQNRPELDKALIAMCELALTEKPLCEWREVLLKVKSTPFLSGESKSRWKANLKWLLDPENIKKVTDVVFHKHSPT